MRVQRSMLLALILCCQLAARPAAAQPAADKRAAAAKAFKRGEALFAQGDYRGASEEFSRAYDLLPHFKVLCNIALCHEQLQDYVKAAEHYQSCIGIGPKTFPDIEKVRGSLQKMRAKIARVQVSCFGRCGALFVDGQLVGDAPREVQLNPGRHVLEVRRTGATPGRKELDAEGGQSYALVLDPQAPTPADKGGGKRRRLSSTWFWTAVGATAALTVTTAILGGLTLSKRSENEELPTVENHDAGVGLRTATNVTLGLAAAAAATGAVLYFFTDFSGKEQRGGQERALVVGVGVHGTF